MYGFGRQVLSPTHYLILEKLARSLPRTRSIAPVMPSKGILLAFLVLQWHQNPPEGVSTSTRACAWAFASDSNLAKEFSFFLQSLNGKDNNYLCICVSQVYLYTMCCSTSNCGQKAHVCAAAVNIKFNHISKWSSGFTTSAQSRNWLQHHQVDPSYTMHQRYGILIINTIIPFLILQKYLLPLGYAVVWDLWFCKLNQL